VSALLLALAARDAGAVEFTVSPVQSDLEIRAGGTAQLVLTVQNQGTDVIGVKTYLWDWWYSDTGHRFEPPGTLDRQAAAWFTPFPRELQLAPDESAVVQLNGSIPKDVSGGYYTVAFVEARPLQPESGAGMGITPGGRIGSLVLLRVAATGTPALALGAVEVSAADGAPAAVSVALSDGGDVHTFATLRAVVRDGAGNVVDRIDGRPLRLLPGQRRSLEVKGTVPLPPGRYEIVGTVESTGGGAPLALRSEFQVPTPAVP
jgi:hypothetical protein